MSDCVNPTELETGALVAYADGQTSRSIQAHLARCPHCAAQVIAYRRTLALLRTALYRRACPAPEQLGLYQLNLLLAAERLVMARHMRECPHCAQELEELARMGDQPSLLEKLRGAVGTIEAVLLPLPRPQTVPLRGAAPALQRFRVALDSGEGVDVHIGVQPGHDRGTRTVMGRLAPHVEALRTPLLDTALTAQTALSTTALGTTAPPLALGQEVWLLRGQEAWAATVEADGTFVFEQVEPGEYAVGLEWQGRTVLARGVKVM